MACLLGWFTKGRKGGKQSNASKLVIDDLPDFLLVEILHRLPCVSIARCKCVSNRWLTLLSDSYFVRHYQCQQRGTLMFSAQTKTDSFQGQGQGQREIFAMVESKELLEFKTRRFSLSFLRLNEEPYVLGMQNDLVLCSPGFHNQCDYYVCNPYTKQWVALPRPCYASYAFGFGHVLVGFICDPNRSTTTTSSSFILNSKHRWKVARIPPFMDTYFKYKDNSFQLKVEIFSSETGHWERSLVSCPRDIRRTYVFSSSAGFAYNGMLYWTGSKGLLIVLNLFKNNNDTSIRTSSNGKFIGECHFIEFDKHAKNIGNECLGIYEGRLRLCHLTPRPACAPRPATLYVWELKEEDRVDGGKFKWCLIDKFSVGQMILENLLIAEWVKSHKQAIRMLALEPNNVEIVYLDMDGHIVMFNIRAKSFKMATKSSDGAFLLWSEIPDNAFSWCQDMTMVFPSVHSCW